MVLWEITVATAYFLGLRRTYRLALKIQRRLISPKYPRIRHFAYRRTRAVFDLALRAHRNIQQRDLEMGKSFGNRILRWLDRMKPSANIRGDPPPYQRNPLGESKRVTSRQSMKETQKYVGGPQQKSSDPSRSEQEGSSDRNLFSAAKMVLPPTAVAMSRSFPLMRQPPMLTLGLTASSTTTQVRRLSVSSYGLKGPEGIFRQDVLLWMKRS